ncbi:TetR/AcrR family transcriptional regulator [Ferrimonas lipolytica]|uniref:TetR/AcrR family transcriptional regulator n=1 Tax=Ferrimonas lipolytica TaxID=2724191 RepID=A0A6H1UBN8_9GAMM|nr:TetR/AcrR family transcriptional regulator [Ferrimonas lipolytica]QIZ76471.1 TetR/AcrR family transcriptional regulator [Ferrimonas lipolytica]
MIDDSNMAPTPISTTEMSLGPKAKVVLQAARKIFLSHGFNGATTDMIQRQAGVSKSTVYAHFKNKETMFLEVIKCECEKFTASVQQIQFVPGDLAATLKVMGQAYLNIALSDSALALYRLVVAESPRFPEVGELFYQTGPLVVKTEVAKYLAQGVAANELALGGHSAEEAAEVFVGLIRNESHMISLTHPNEPVDVAAQQRRLNVAIDVLIRGYGSRE